MIPCTEYQAACTGTRLERAHETTVSHGLDSGHEIERRGEEK
jgi:hypothetical protein